MLSCVGLTLNLINMNRIERLKELIPKLKANKKIHPLKIESLEWELKYLESEKKQLSIYDVVSSFFIKEAKTLGIDADELYLSFYKNEIYLSKVDKDDYYFNLQDVRKVK